MYDIRRLKLNTEGPTDLSRLLAQVISFSAAVRVVERTNLVHDPRVHFTPYSVVSTISAENSHRGHPSVADIAMSVFESMS